MEYQELFRKYNILPEQVDQLTQENRRLKAKLGLQEPPTLRDTTQPIQMEIAVPDGESNDVKSHANINSVNKHNKKNDINFLTT
jgi:hypothetical protein